MLFVKKRKNLISAADRISHLNARTQTETFRSLIFMQLAPLICHSHVRIHSKSRHTGSVYDKTLTYFVYLNNSNNSKDSTSSAKSHICIQTCSLFKFLPRITCILYEFASEMQAISFMCECEMLRAVTVPQEEKGMSDRANNLTGFWNNQYIFAATGINQFADFSTVDWHWTCTRIVDLVKD